jgi:hypothetical protein
LKDDPQAFQREIRRLQQRIASLESRLRRIGGGLHGMLKRRGLRVQRFVASNRLLLHPGLSHQDIDRFYRLLHRYSFRLLLRDVIRLRERFLAEDLTSYCSLQAARGYLTSLRGLGLIEQEASGLWRLTRPTVTSFGETLEWFVAEVLRREFFAEALESVSFRSPPPGGDYDVVAWVEGFLTFVEVKSSPPRGIEAEEVKGFLERREILSPHLALFLVDTHLRMKDKMIPIFEELLSGIPRDSEGPSKKMQRLEREIFHAGHRIYVLNASKGIQSNLRCCFMDHLRHAHAFTAATSP